MTTTTPTPALADLDLKALRAAAEKFCADNLNECAAELHEWQSKGQLCNGKLRQLGELCEKYVGQHDGLKVAERLVEFDSVAALARRAAQPVAASRREAPTATHGPLHLTNRKTAEIAATDYKIVGYVLRREDGEAVCISAESTVRWLPQAHYWRLMHEQGGSLFATPAPASAGQAAPASLPDVAMPEQMRYAAFDEIAAWYAKEGWLLDEDDVPDAIRALAAQPAEGAGQASLDKEPQRDSTEAAKSAGQAGQVACDSEVLRALRDGIPLQEPVYIGKALRAQREARVCLSGGTGPVACAMLVNIQITGWAEGPATAEAFVQGYNRALKDYRHALLEVATERAAAPADLEQQLIERRIGLTPENEGGWHAQVYGDSETPLAKGYGATPSEAIRSATHQPSAQVKP